MTKTELTLPPGTKVPNHIAIIPDGMRRWAKEQNLPAIEGHRSGAKVAIKLIRSARHFGIHTVTAWGFSTENWNRSGKEIDHLMSIFEQSIKDNLKEMQDEEVRFIHLGRKDRLTQSLSQTIAEAEEKTSNNRKHIFNFALDYGGQDEILRAIEKVIEDIKTGKLEPAKLREEVGKYQEKYPYYYFKNYLDTRDQPHPFPDLVIRTSGEQRLSGFMRWQTAYSELYFEPSHFPDFTPEKLKEAILEYSKRSRRFGGN